MAKMFRMMVGGIVGVLLLGMVAGSAFAADPTPTPAPPAWGPGAGWCGCPGCPGWDGSGSTGVGYGGWGYGGGWGRWGGWR